jgi:hypothetical protein
LKDFQEIQSSSDYDGELPQKISSALEDLREKDYEPYLSSSCWLRASTFLQQYGQGGTTPGTVYAPLIGNYVCDSNGDGKADFCYGASVERYVSYEQVKQLYQSLTASMDSMTVEERCAACAEIFNSIAQGSPAEQHKLAQLTREIINNDKLVFEDAEVFDLAKDHATVFSKYATGDWDWGVQQCNVTPLSETAAQLNLSYWGEMWYSVKMVPLGEQWVTGEFTAPYQGELGQYLMTVQFHDAEPSEKLLEQYSMWTDHKLLISHGGTDREMTMRIVPNADHGYNVYIGSDDPFWVDEQSSVMLNRLIGTFSVQLNFTTGNTDR